MKAIFLDRDGTIIVDHPYQYLPEQLVFFPWTFEALRIFKEKGFSYFLITNQSGIARGHFNENHLEHFHQYLQKELQKRNLEKFKDISYCPHAPEDGCPCRKPSAKMILDFIEKYNIDKNQSYMLGDKPLDAMAGKNAGIKGYQLAEGQPFTNILDFAKSL